MGALLDRPWGPSAGNPSGLTVVPPNTSGALPGPLPALQLFPGITEVAIANPTVPSVALSVAIPPNTGIEQIPFELNCSGYITVGVAGNVTLKLYSGNAITGTLLKSSGALAIAAPGTFPFWIHAKMMFDSISGTLAGMVDFYANQAVVAATTLSNFPGGLKNTNNPVAQFIVSGQFSVANAANAINIQKFSVG